MAIAMTSIWTEAQLREEIAITQDAIRACVTGKSYTIGNHSLTRQDLDVLRAHLDYLQGELVALTRGRGPYLVQGRMPGGWR